jgi:hypothetical protein
MPKAAIKRLGLQRALEVAYFADLQLYLKVFGDIYVLQPFVQ